MTSLPETPRAMDPDRPLMIVGHRGVAGLAPENTLVSFQMALDVPVDMIELDVHPTRDGEIVVMHDPHVGRTTDGEGLINDYTLAELKELDAAAKFGGELRYDVQRVPTLQEVYDLVRGRTKVNIEIKRTTDGGRYPGIEEKLVEIVRRNDASAFTVFSSFDFGYLKQARALEPAVGQYGIVWHDYFQRMGSQPEVAVADWLDHGLRGIAVHKQHLSAELMALLKRERFFVGAWVIDDVEEMFHFARMGVDFTTSDRPDILALAYREASTR